MSQRIKGQEVAVILVVNGTPQDTITDVVNFEFTYQFELKKQGYLGETTDRRDEVFMGIAARMELHFENQDIFVLVQAVQDRAQRREPGTQINIKATLNFPNGDRPRVLVPNVFFGNLPIHFPGRTEYGTTTLEMEASSAKTILS